SLLFGLYVFVSKSWQQEGHLHLEFASGLIFTGLVSFWCAYRFNQSAPVRYFVIIFFALIAGVHWLDYLRGVLPVSSPLVNSLPVSGMILAEILYRSGRGKQASPAE
ncbi:MAG: hypothetical protein R3330_17015, partial [Saprospiraceae bacterium]|nr:hypothetical protein [Saprospiraceae bacterium]